MPPKSSFYEQLQSHVGGLAKLVKGTQGTRWRAGKPMVGKIGLLVSARRGKIDDSEMVLIELLIDGSIHEFYVFLGEIELIGGDDVS
jgi:hypothetical protein